MFDTSGRLHGFVGGRLPWRRGKCRYQLQPPLSQRQQTDEGLLNQAANAAVKTKGSIFEFIYRRLVPRLGHAQAAGAVAPAPGGGGNGFGDPTVVVPRRPSMVVEPANGRVPVMAWAEIPTSIPAHLSTLTSSMAPPFEEKPTPYIHFVSRA